MKYTKAFAGRRGFLRGLAIAPIAAAQLAKAAQAEALTGATVSGYAGLPDAAIGTAPRQGRPIWSLLKRIGLPDWKRKQIRQHARDRRTLDPDIASLRSVSLNAKFQMQWRRNERQMEQSIFDDLLTKDDRDSFNETHRVNWW